MAFSDISELPNGKLLQPVQQGKSKVRKLRKKGCPPISKPKK